MRRYLLPSIVLTILLGLLCAGCGGGDDDQASVAPVIGPKVVVLATGVTASLNADDGTVIVRSTDVKDIPTLAKGDVIVSDNGNGLLRKVTDTSVKLTNDGLSIQVPTTQATMEDTFYQVDFDFTKALTSNDIDYVDYLVPGMRAASTPRSGMTETFNLTNMAIKDGVVASGTLSVSLGIDLHINVLKSRLTSFRSAPIMRTMSTISVNSSVKLAKFNTELKLCTIYGKPIKQMVNGVPLVFTPRYTLYATFSGNTEQGARWEATTDITYTGGAQYDHGWQAIDLLNFPPIITVPDDFMPTPPANVSAQLCLSDVEAGLQLYGVTGPYSRVRAPFFDSSWTYSIANGHPQLKIDLDRGMDGSAGSKATILAAWLNDYTTKLYGQTASVDNFPKTVESPGGGIDVVVD